MSDKMSNEAIAAAALAILVRDAAIFRGMTTNEISDAVPADDWQARWEHALRESRSWEATRRDPQERVHKVAETVRASWSRPHQNS